MTDTPTLRTGARLRSQVCTTEVVVVRPPKRDVTLTCGGAPMVDIKATPDEAVAAGGPQAGLDGGTQMGKRYTLADDESLEVLVSKAGGGTLADGTTPLVLKEAKPLPASD